MDNPDVTWEEVPEHDVPPPLTDTNAAELLRRIANERRV